MEKILRQVKCNERLPSVNRRYYYTEVGEVFFDGKYFQSQTDCELLRQPEYWYEEVSVDELEDYKVAVGNIEMINDLLKLEIKNLEDLLIVATQNDLDRHKEIINKYGELSWQIEELTNDNLSENGISNNLFRQLVRELLNKRDKERYKEAFEFIRCNFKEEMIGIEILEALKIASGINEKENG